MTATVPPLPPPGADRDDPGPSPNATPDHGSAARPRAVRWWAEALAVVVLYAAYSFVRGKVSADAPTALANAERVLRVEGLVGIDSELGIQRFALQWPGLVRLCNIVYGMFHFVVPILALVLLARRMPARYRVARNALIATTLLGLVGFALFPLMPPRLLCACTGGAGIDYGYVDTLARYGGLWTFGSHAVTAVSNPYAAMPSLHFAWALWCAVALRPALRTRAARAAVTAYPVVTAIVIVVTGNHYWLDALGGAAVVAGGWVLATAHARRRPAPERPGPTGAGNLAPVTSREGSRGYREPVARPGTTTTDPPPVA